MHTQDTPQERERHRTTWAKIAKANNCYYEPFYIQFFLDFDGHIVDSVAHKGMKEATSDYNYITDAYTEPCSHHYRTYQNSRSRKCLKCGHITKD